MNCLRFATGVHLHAAVRAFVQGECICMMHCLHFCRGRCILHDAALVFCKGVCLHDALLAFRDGGAFACCSACVCARGVHLHDALLALLQGKMHFA